MSPFEIIPTAFGFQAIEANANHTALTIQTFDTRLAARKWVLDRLDHLASLEQEAIRVEMGRTMTTACSPLKPR